MKLRNKLAAVLAATLTITSIPVVTMASSKNNMTQSAVVATEGTVYNNPTAAPSLKVNFEDFSAGHTEVFYLTVKNAEWLAGATQTIGTETFTSLVDQTGAPISTASVKMIRESKSVVRVEVSAIPTGEIFSTSSATTVKLPMLVELTGGEATVSLTTEGSSSTITEENDIVFASTSTEIAEATVSSTTSFNRDGKIGTIEIKEAYRNSMNKTGTQYNYALVEIDDADFTFDLSNATKLAGTHKVAAKDNSGEVIEFTTDSNGTFTKYEMNAEYAYGFAGKGLTKTVAGDTVEYVNVYVSADEESMYVELPNNINALSKGVIKLNSVYVQSEVKNPSATELKVDISGHVKDVKDLVVATLGDYSAAITVAEDKLVDIKAGQTEEVEFTLKEAVDGTFTNNRAFDFTLENGYFMEASEVSGKVSKSQTLADFKAAFTKIEQKGSSTTAYSDAQVASAITDVVIEDEKVVGFTFKPQVNYAGQKLDSFTFTTDISVGIAQAGEIKVAVESRDLDEAVTGVVANAKAVVEVTSEVAVLKTGLMDQVAGKITIEEKEANVLTRGEELIVLLPNVSGIEFSKTKPEVKVTAGDVQVSDIKVTTEENADGKEVPALVMTIKRESKTASTIEISNFHIDTDRTVAQGKYDAEIGGKALTSHKETITVEDFITIGTANTEDLVGANGLAKGTSTFKIGEAQYTLNGVEKVMDAASYIQNPGYTMIPVRYVAEAFGVKGNDILFSNGTATIFAGNRTVQLTNNSDVAVVNGAQVKLATKVVMKDGRTYAPVGEIARILGVSSSWDNETKTATFTNN